MAIFSTIDEKKLHYQRMLDMLRADGASPEILVALVRMLASLRADP